MFQYSLFKLRTTATKRIPGIQHLYNNIRCLNDLKITTTGKIMGMSISYCEHTFYLSKCTNVSLLNHLFVWTLFSSRQRNLFALLSMPEDFFACCFVFLSCKKKMVTVGWRKCREGYTYTHGLEMLDVMLSYLFLFFGLWLCLSFSSLLLLLPLLGLFVLLGNSILFF